MKEDVLREQVKPKGGIKEALASQQTRIDMLTKLGRSGLEFHGQTRQGIFDMYKVVRDAIDLEMQKIRESGQEPTPEDIALITDIHEAVRPLLGNLIRAAEFKGETRWGGAAFGHPDREAKMKMPPQKDDSELV